MQCVYLCVFQANSSTWSVLELQSGSAEGGQLQYRVVRYWREDHGAKVSSCLWSLIHRIHGFLASYYVVRMNNPYYPYLGGLSLLPVWSAVLSVSQQLCRTSRCSSPCQRRLWRSTRLSGRSCRSEDSH